MTAPWVLGNTPRLTVAPSFMYVFRPISQRMCLTAQQISGMMLSFNNATTQNWLIAISRNKHVKRTYNKISYYATLSIMLFHV